MIGVLAFIQNLFNSNSVYVHHFFAHIASILIIIYTAKTTDELGGGKIAIIIALSCIIIGPGFGRSQQLFQPVVFSQLFWVLNFYSLTRFVKYLDKKSLWWLTVFAALGFSVKYDALFFVFGAASLFFFKRTRDALLQLRFWENILAIALFLTPNLIWQWLNHWPAMQMFDRLYETQLDDFSRKKNLLHLLIAINPIVSVLVVIPAFIYLFKRKEQACRPLVLSILLSFSFLCCQNGKSYYFFPIVLTILPFGALLWEQYILQKNKWVIYPFAAIFSFGSLLIPFGMPIYTFKHYLNSIYKYEYKIIKGGTLAIKYDEYYAKEKWEKTMQKLKAVYDTLSLNDKQGCMIWGKHYGQAGAVSIYQADYNLPDIFSYHGSFYNWAPKGEMPNTIIALSYQVGNFFNPYFEDVKLVDSLYNPYADNEEELYQKIYICKKPRQNFDGLRVLFKARIFE